MCDKRAITYHRRSETPQKPLETDVAAWLSREVRRCSVEIRAGQDRVTAEVLKLEFGTKSTRQLDSGKEPIENSPLFGGQIQKEMF